MSTKYCENCGHEKRFHIKRRFLCRVRTCQCKNYVEGEIKDSRWWRR